MTVPPEIGSGAVWACARPTGTPAAPSAVTARIVRSFIGSLPTPSLPVPGRPPSPHPAERSRPWPESDASSLHLELLVDLQRPLAAQIERDLRGRGALVEP